MQDKFIRWKRQAEIAEEKLSEKKLFKAKEEETGKSQGNQGGVEFYLT